LKEKERNRKKLSRKAPPPPPPPFWKRSHIWGRKIWQAGCRLLRRVILKVFSFFELIIIPTVERRRALKASEVGLDITVFGDCPTLTGRLLLEVAQEEKP